ncbi:hypothetical protein ACH5RR_008420 [Cinchona calisaya]|uniref:NF-X1-type domain-containing protein n=1 Tax=Cinchona calisaya TaxID=153742 RepID=A0ABD3AH69_9GENT
MSSKEIRYVCFCGKRHDLPSDLYLTSHSCGRALEKEVPGSGMKEDLCPHLCVLQCHLGPCPPCKAFAPQCDKILDCGCHRCERTRHVGPCGSCEVLVNASCFCRKKIEVVLCGDMVVKGEIRADGVFSCSSTCGKKLGCGNHVCDDICRPRPCGECDFQTVECYKTRAENENFTCDKPCGQKKNCGRHQCSERCCPLSNPYNSISGNWDPHLCSMPCVAIVLRLDTIFTDLTCACGRTSIPPPLPCGTPAPSCQYPCSVPQPCGHPSTHSCHFGDCPPCTIPIAKKCISGHVVLRNIPCGSKDIRCNKLCSKTRQCGLHACARTCHPSPCDTPTGTSTCSKASCGQACGASRRDCRHTCTALCHPSASCPDVRCEFPVSISCSCGRITATVPCDAGGNVKVPLGRRKLMCNDDCVKTERKKVLADAFGVTTPNLDALHCGDNAVVSEVLSDLLRREPKWVLFVEERCKYLVLGKGRVTPNSKAPARMLGMKGSLASNMLQPPVFDPMVDMDPRLVVALFDLPRDADVSALVLRFGSECELVWLNDKNDLAVFIPHNVGASTAAAASSTNAWEAMGPSKDGVAVAALKGNPWKKAVMLENGRESSWGAEDWSDNSVDLHSSIHKGNEDLISATNRWSILDSENCSSLFVSSLNSEDPENKPGTPLVPTVEVGTSSPVLPAQLQGAGVAEISGVVDNWEKAYD